MIETTFQQNADCGAGRSSPPAGPEAALPCSGPIRAQPGGRRATAFGAPFRPEDVPGLAPQRRKGRGQGDSARNQAARLRPSLASQNGHHSVTDIHRKGIDSASIQEAVWIHYRNSIGLNAALSPGEVVPSVFGRRRRQAGRAQGATPRPRNRRQT